MDVALVGAGRVGTAVAFLLQQAGHRIVGVGSRTLDSASLAAERLGSDTYRIEDFPAADLVLLGAADPALEGLARVIAPRLRDGAFVCHFAGAFGPEPLRAVVELGASACAIHPVQACPTVDAAIARLPGSAWGVTCSDPGAEDRMLELIDQDLRGFAVVIPEELRPIWHAAAVMTSNGIAALLASGEALLAEIGVGDPARVLGPLAAGTVQNAREGGGGAATLTGPVVRGEKETLKRHLAAVAERSEVQQERYKAIVSFIVEAALSAKRIDEESAAQIRNQLDG